MFITSKHPLGVVAGICRSNGTHALGRGDITETGTALETEQQVRDRLHSKGTYLWSSSISMGTLQNCCAARYGQLGHFWKKTYRNQPVASDIIKHFRQKYDFSFDFLKESLHLPSAAGMWSCWGGTEIPLENQRKKAYFCQKCLIIPLATGWFRYVFFQKCPSCPYRAAQQFCRVPKLIEQQYLILDLLLP